MTGPCFVDANVFIYVRDGRDVRKQARAAEWLGDLWHHQLGRTSTQAIGSVTVRNPFTLQVGEAAALYAVERREVSLHRPRGRPRRAAATV
jgi:predicted nucleic acid-binding protein